MHSSPKRFGRRRHWSGTWIVWVMAMASYAEISSIAERNPPDEAIKERYTD
jgi:hypothetical protein